MEYQELIGTRRSIRYFEPDKPVEQDKIQKILEACLIASCAVNAHWCKAVVVKRQDVAPDDLEKMKNPVQAAIVEMAPVYIYFYLDPTVVNRIKGSRLKELVDKGALNPTHGWSHKFVDDVVYPQILKPLTESPAYVIAAAFDCGVAACQGLLMSFELGLGGILTAYVADVVKKYTKVPDEWLPLYVLNVGYRAESKEAGGQRPRPPFDEQYFLGSYPKGFPRDPKVVEELRKTKMIQAPAMLAGRKEEIRKLADRLGLPM